VPARQIPAPPTVNPQAQALLANPPQFAGQPLPKDPKDKAGWRAHIADSDQWLLATPEADLTESIAVYAQGHDLCDPYLSPIFGDFSKGSLPTILTSGTRELFLSNTVLMHRALRSAGIDAELHVWEAMSQGGFFGAPEDQEVLAEQWRSCPAEVAEIVETARLAHDG
jgi:acetyl esterase/lipase